MNMLTSYFLDESLYQMGWQFSCHLITGRNVKDLSKGVAVQLRPYDR